MENNKYCANIFVVDDGRLCLECALVYITL